MFSITMFCCLLHKRDRTVGGPPRKSPLSGRQMYNFFSSSWHSHIHGFCCLKTYQARFYSVGKIIFHLPPGQLVCSSMLSGSRFEDLQTDKIYSSVKVSLNISHVNSTFTISTGWFIVLFLFMMVQSMDDRECRIKDLPDSLSLYVSKSYFPGYLFLYLSAGWTFLTFSCVESCVFLYFSILYVVVGGVCVRVYESRFIKIWHLCCNFQNKDIMNGNIFWFSMHWFQVNKSMLFIISRSLLGTPSLQTSFFTHRQRLHTAVLLRSPLELGRPLSPLFGELLWWDSVISCRLISLPVYTL